MKTPRTTVLSALGLLCVPLHAWAHTGRAPEPHDLWRTWTLAPAVLVALTIAALWYAVGAHVLRRRAPRASGLARWRVASFWSGWLALAIALVSPIDRVSSALFAVHMTQHLLLVAVAAPLLVLGEPLLPLLFALPLSERRMLGRGWKRVPVLGWVWGRFSRPIIAWTLHVGMLWLWHVPRMYDAALRSESVHILEHTLFFGTALLFWWVLLGRQHALATGPAVAYLFTAMLQSTLLGALLTMARRPLYFSHYGTTTAWGLTPLQDQQLAGLIMWIPAGAVYLVALLPIVLTVLREDKGKQQPKELLYSVGGVSARGTP